MGIVPDPSSPGPHSKIESSLKLRYSEKVRTRNQTPRGLFNQLTAKMSTRLKRQGVCTRYPSLYLKGFSIRKANRHSYPLTQMWPTLPKRGGGQKSLGRSRDNWRNHQLWVIWSNYCFWFFRIVERPFYHTLNSHSLCWPANDFKTHLKSQKPTLT